jgi:hypothetical protein
MLGERPPDLPRHVGGVIVVVVRCWPSFERDGAVGERALEGDGSGGYGAGGERIAMVAWRMLARRRQKRNNSATARLFSHDDWKESR